jgi:hypothetical protein
MWGIVLVESLTLRLRGAAFFCDVPLQPLLAKQFDEALLKANRFPQTPRSLSSKHPPELSPEAVLKSEKLRLQACKRFPELVQFIARTMNLKACDLADF